MVVKGKIEAKLLACLSSVGFEWILAQLVENGGLLCWCDVVPNGLKTIDNHFLGGQG